ncbi:MAG: hypothetical protein IAC58_01660 [Firmicutes bacterium]|uniref:Uncharacterized protein n=1 Tax=Candidatus Onthovivens merdipullorum TaxID=2840889 RepID=A0A9D9GU19_9BACL|nr:hypothetical protein [Candidatus Onthovivens merdipullorum]
MDKEIMEHKEINVYKILCEYLYAHKDDIITDFSLYKKSKYLLFFINDEIYIVLKSKSKFINGNIIDTLDKVLKVSNDNNIELYFHLLFTYSFSYSVYSIVADSNIERLISNLFEEHYIKLIKKRKLFNNLCNIDKKLIEAKSLYGMDSKIQFPIYCIIEYELVEDISIIRIDNKDCISLDESENITIKKCFLYRVGNFKNPICINYNNYFVNYDSVNNLHYSIVGNYIFADIVKFPYKIYKSNSKLTKYLEMNYMRLLVN